MSCNGKLATGEFTLAVEPGQTWKPVYDRYQILLTDSEGHPCRRPTRYHIDVVRDLPPEIRIDEPKQEAVDVAVGGQLKIHVHASDDFGLRRVALKAEHNGIPLGLPVLLDRMPPEKAFGANGQPYDENYDFVPAKFSLKKGDEVTYWAEADDNKEPKHNHSETARHTIRIVDDGDAGQGQAKQEGGKGDENKQPGDGAAAAGQGTRPERERERRR